MTRQDNFTTVEPMTEAEAMQAAREKLIFGKIHIKEIALLIGWKVDNGQKFLEAREEVFAIEEEEGGWFEPRRALRQNPHQFDEWVKNQKARTLNEYLCYCFPEITKETAEKIIELDRERCKIKSIEVGRKEYVSLKRSEVVFKQRLEKAEAIVKKVAPNPLKHLEDEEHPEVWTKVDVGYMNEYNKLLAVVFNMLQRKETNRREIYSSKNFTPFHQVKGLAVFWLVSVVTAALPASMGLVPAQVREYPLHSLECSVQVRSRNQESSGGSDHILFEPIFPGGHPQVFARISFFLQVGMIVSRLSLFPHLSRLARVRMIFAAIREDLSTLAAFFPWFRSVPYLRDAVLMDKKLNVSATSAEVVVHALSLCSEGK
jgi:hypothetical protein